MKKISQVIFAGLSISAFASAGFASMAGTVRGGWGVNSGIESDTGISASPMSSHYALFGATLGYDLKEESVVVGGFWDRGLGSLQDQTRFSADFWGITFRTRIAHRNDSNIFFEGKFGLAKGYTDAVNSPYRPAVAAAVSYAFRVFPFMDLRPQLEYRVLSLGAYNHDPVTQNAVTGSLCLDLWL